MGNDRLRAERQAHRALASAAMGRRDVEEAVPGSVRRGVGRQMVLVCWAGDDVLILASVPDGPGGWVLVDQLPRPLSPDVREGGAWDSWRVGPHRVRVSRAWRSVAAAIED